MVVPLQIAAGAKWMPERAKMVACRGKLVNSGANTPIFKRIFWIPHASAGLDPHAVLLTSEVFRCLDAQSVREIAAVGRLLHGLRERGRITMNYGVVAVPDAAKLQAFIFG